MFKPGAFVVGVCLWGGLGGCGSTPLQPSCPPGATYTCHCPSGAVGLQICGDKGPGDCHCAGEPAAMDGGTGDGSGLGANGNGGAGTGGGGGSATGGAAGAGSGGAALPGSGGAAGSTVDAGGSVDGALPGPDAGSDVISMPPPSTGCVAAGKLAAGSELLIDVFAVPDGIVIVRSDAVVLMGRDRVVKKTVMAPRPINTAAFDGTSLVVADAALFTVFSLTLEPQGTVLLTEACASSAITKGGVFVCGPANDWDRIFYTYSIADRKSIARSSNKFTYHGTPMKVVPGTDYFVTVTTNSSPSDFFLYRVMPGGTDVIYVNESPYHGDFAATRTFAFAGTPPTHLVNTDGLLLRLFGDGCDSMHNSFTSGCFVKDGNLGTLPMARTFAALANDEQGRMFSLLRGTTGSTSFFDPLCPGGCSLQQIDVDARRVVSEQKHMMAARQIIALRPDSACKMVAVGYAVATSSSSSTDYAGYQVDLLDYGAAP